MKKVEKKDTTIEKDFPEYTSLIESQENILALLEVIGSDKPEAKSLLKKFKGHDFENLYYFLVFDKSKEKKLFQQMLKDETKGNVDLLKELTNILKKKVSKEGETYNDLLKKKADVHALWSKISEEKKALQKENEKITSKLNDFLGKKRWLAAKRDFINYKLSEYGDEKKIHEYYELWVKEYESAMNEEKALRAEYEKAKQDERFLPRIYGDVSKEIKKLKDEMDFTKYEIEQIFRVSPDIEERAKESGEIVDKYRSVHKNLQETTTALNDNKNLLKNVEAEEKEVSGKLSVAEEELAPFLETENDLKNKLAEIMNRFNRQEELREEKSALKDVINPLEKKVQEWREKIENHEKKSTKMKEEIESMKSESHKTAAELKEYEALVGPVKEMKQKLETMEKELSEATDQEKRFTKEIKAMKKENDMLSIKAKQYEMIKHKLEGMK